MIRKLSSIAITVCAFAFARQASAQMATAPMTSSPPPAGGVVVEEGVDRAGGIVGGLVGFGTHTGAGFALGVEGGYTLPMHLYIGGDFNYYFGSLGVSEYLIQAQVGYDLGVIKAAPILIRPYVGVGYLGLNVPGCTAACDVAGVPSGGFVFSPGVLGAYFFNPHWYAGVDLRVDIIAISFYGGANLDLFGTGGYKF